jgi:hypothetical protein
LGTPIVRCKFYYRTLADILSCIQQYFMKVILSAVLSALFLASCASSSSEKEYVSPTAVAAQVTATDTLQKKNADGIEQILGANAAKPTAVQVPVNVPTTTAQPVTAPVAVNAVPSATQTTAAGINPAHGQPGHHCDIAVGAPLNSKPVTAKSATATKTIQPAIAQQRAPVKPAAHGMNPAHGQPGHRCEIAVGAPLNSAPAKKDSAR